jgi:predicted  nucleic acid-binding Zn-ribbon protein
MSKKEKDKDKKNELSTSQILGETRNVLFGENTQLTAVLNNLVTLFSRMDSRLSSIEENTGKNTRTLNQMDDKLTSLTSRVITVENEITSVKTRVSDLETSSQGTSNLFDEIKETTETTKKGLEKIITRHQQTQFDRTKMTEDMKRLEEENSKLKEGLIDVQCRSMKTPKCVPFKSLPEFFTSSKSL